VIGFGAKPDIEIAKCYRPRAERSSTLTTYRDRHLAGLYLPEDQQAERTVDELKAALKEQGKPVSGTKDELIARLAEDTE
jgi:predicted nucleic acid-binding protein